MPGFFAHFQQGLSFLICYLACPQETWANVEGIVSRSCCLSQHIYSIIHGRALKRVASNELGSLNVTEGPVGFKPATFPF